MPSVKKLPRSKKSYNGVQCPKCGVTDVEQVQDFEQASPKVIFETVCCGECRCTFSVSYTLSLCVEILDTPKGDTEVMQYPIKR